MVITIFGSSRARALLEAVIILPPVQIEFIEVTFKPSTRICSSFLREALAFRGLGG